MHTVVFGRGILALTSAFRLARRAKDGDRITIVGSQDRTGSASLAAGAMLNSFAEIDVGALDSDLGLYHFELSHRASRMWPQFENEIIQAAGDSLPAGCTKCQGCTGGGCYSDGTYIINNTAADEIDDQNFDAIIKAMEDFNEPFAHVSPADIPNYRPSQRHRATRAVLLHNEGWFNPRLMLEKLENALLKDPNVHFINSMVKRFVKSAALIDHAELEDGTSIAGDKYLLATGANVSSILNASDLGIGVQRVFYGSGISLEIKSPDAIHTKCIRTPNRGLACGLYSVPYFTDPNQINDHILIGATNHISATPVLGARLISIESLMRAVMEQINTEFYRAELVRVNVGWRPTSQDTYPLIGPTSISNLLIASGTKRDGFHMSPLLSEILTAMIYDEPVDERFSIFAPERKPIRDLTREQAISKTVNHQISAAYQHDFMPAKDRMVDDLKAYYRDQLERLHDKVGAYDWGIPPEMTGMYHYGHAVP